MKKRKKLKKKGFVDYVGKGLYVFIIIFIVSNFWSINHYIGSYETDIKVLIISLLWINGFLLCIGVIAINNYKKYLKDQQDW